MHGGEVELGILGILTNYNMVDYGVVVVALTTMEEGRESEHSEGVRGGWHDGKRGRKIDARGRGEVMPKEVRGREKEH